MRHNVRAVELPLESPIATITGTCRAAATDAVRRLADAVAEVESNTLQEKAR
jgi:hypothetical protein